MPRRLRSIKSYALYYGMGGDEELSRYDLAIVDPGGRRLGGIQRLKERGTIALAYVSVLEVPHTADRPPANVLLVGGQPLVQTTWGNWVLDPRSPETRQRLLQQVDAVMQLKYDGVFLDCISNAEDRTLPPDLVTELVPAAARLVGDIAQRHRDCVIVQNWGLHRLLPLTASVIDGLCWEDFPFDQIGAVPTVHSGIRYLRSVNQQTGLRMLALNHGIVDDAARRLAMDAAERCGFLWYGCYEYIQLPSYRQR